MDLKTTVSSVDASEVTFVQDKTLLVAVKGQFSSSLGEFFANVSFDDWEGRMSRSRATTTAATTTTTTSST